LVHTLFEPLPSPVSSSLLRFDFAAGATVIYGIGDEPIGRALVDGLGLRVATLEGQRCLGVDLSHGRSSEGRFPVTDGGGHYVAEVGVSHGLVATGSQFGWFRPRLFSEGTEITHVTGALLARIENTSLSWLPDATEKRTWQLTLVEPIRCRPHRVCLVAAAFVWHHCRREYSGD
jgi:hypothetical protein